MNIEQARSLSLEDFIKRLGHPEVNKGNNREAWFLSPLRTEKTPSFKVDRQRNKFIDFGDGTKGDIIDFVRAYGPRAGWGSPTVSDSLKRIADVVGNLPQRSFRPSRADRRGFGNQEKTSAATDNSVRTFRIDHIGSIQSKSLVDYLRQRQLHVNTAKEYLKQIIYTHVPSSRQYYGLTWPNEAGGQEVRSPHFKTIIGNKAPSIVEVNDPRKKPGTALFEGMTDYLSYLKIAKDEVMARAVIMNSTSMHHRVADLLNSLPPNEPVRAYLQNDTPGLKVAAKIREAVPHVLLQNHKYAAYSDLNNFLTGKPMKLADKDRARTVLEGSLKPSEQEKKLTQKRGIA